jgi:c(7)-type cytochrome triheme protein
MGCHAIMKADKAEVKKIREYWDRQEPIPWIKIYGQPDFVYFSHKRHGLKGIACKTCHGAVETMDRVQKAVVLDMDRCVACHMEKKASIDCLTCHR